jgi:hypothetical protein
VEDVAEAQAQSLKPVFSGDTFVVPEDEVVAIREWLTHRNQPASDLDIREAYINFQIKKNLSAIESGDLSLADVVPPGEDFTDVSALSTLIDRSRLTREQRIAAAQRHATMEALGFGDPTRGSIRIAKRETDRALLKYFVGLRIGLSDREARQRAGVPPRSMSMLQFIFSEAEAKEIMGLPIGGGK